MKRWQLDWSWLLGLLSLTLTTAQQPVVVLDPGHGGTDSGAIGTNGVLEKEIVLQIAKECLRLNRTLFKDSLTIYLTRYQDTLIRLGDRSRLAVTLKADSFVSIHCNQAPNTGAQGFEVFKHPKAWVQQRTKIIADTLASHIKTRLGIHDRGIKPGNFQVLRETHPYCPALLLEIGFLSNAVEAHYTTKMESQTAMALAILESLIKTLYHD